MLALAGLGWRGTAWGVALLALVLLLPLSFYLLRRCEGSGAARELRAAAEPIRPQSRGSGLFRDKRFLGLLLVIAPQPFIGTGVIFFQSVIADYHGWPGGTFATGFLIFALSRGTCSIVVGAWADRVGPQRLLGLSSALLGSGLLWLLWSSPFGGYAYFTAMGLCFGISSAITSPIFSATFGLERIGEVRGASSSVTIFATALAPAVFGLALQLGLQPTSVLLGCAAFLLFVSLPLACLIRRHLLRA